VFSLVNLLGSLRVPRFDATLWWIDLRAYNMAREVAALWVYYLRPLTARQQAQL